MDQVRLEEAQRQASAAVDNLDEVIATTVEHFRPALEKAGVAIEIERGLLEPVKSEADLVIEEGAVKVQGTDKQLLWHEIGLAPGPATVRDLWTGEEFEHVDDGTIATRLRRPMPGHGVVMLRVTPGVRPADAELGDQERVMTPAQALERGADWLVIGRPIIAAPSPGEAFSKIRRELDGADADTHGKNGA